MGLQEQIAEAIVIAFDDLGGKPLDAVKEAVKHATTRSWLQQELAVGAIAGGVEMAIPGFQALTIPAGIAYLMHKMAYISWGIGAIKGAYVIETAHYSDLRNILTLWANSAYYNVHLLDHMAISMSIFDYALTDEGAQRLHESMQGKDTQNVVVKSLDVLDHLVHDFGGDEQAQQLIQAITQRDQVIDMVISAQDRVPLRESVFERSMQRRISTKLALRLASRISARIPARFIMGFVPIAGPIVNAFANVQTLNSMADCATKYYDNQLTRATLQAEA